MTDFGRGGGLNADWPPSGEAHYHFYCFERTKQLHGDSCPRCRVSYETDPPAPIGEDAVRRAEDDFVGGIRNRKRPRSGRKASRNDAEEEEEDEVESEEDQLESQDPSQSQDQTQSQSQSQVEEQSQAPPVNNNRVGLAHSMGTSRLMKSRRDGQRSRDLTGRDRAWCPRHSMTTRHEHFMIFMKIVMNVMAHDAIELYVCCYPLFRWAHAWKSPG